MKWIDKIKNFIINEMFFYNLKKMFGDGTDDDKAQKFADFVNESGRQYWNLKIINLNKYLTRSVQGVLYLFNYDKKVYHKDSNLKYKKELPMYSEDLDKEKFTSYRDNFDFEDYKKIIFYDDLYEIYIKQYLYWEVPDDNPTESLIETFVRKVESYPSIKLKQIKEKFSK